MRERAEERRESARRRLRTLALALWYLALLAAILLLHDFPNREFRYWKL